MWSWTVVMARPSAIYTATARLRVDRKVRLSNACTTCYTALQKIRWLERCSPQSRPAPGAGDRRLRPLSARGHRRPCRAVLLRDIAVGVIRQEHRRDDADDGAEHDVYRDRIAGAVGGEQRRRDQR